MTTLFPQTNEWRAGMQEVSAAIDEAMGELVTITPAMPSRPNFSSIPDPARAVTVTAVFTSLAKTVLMGEHTGRINSGHSISPLISTSEPIFSFSYNVLPYTLLQGYRITRICSGEVFEIKDLQSDGVSRITAKVVQLGRELEMR